MLAFFQQLFGWVQDGLQAAWDAIVVALQVAYALLKAGVGAIWDAAKWTYSNILKPIGQFVHDAYDRLKALYTSILKPILDWSKRITDALRRVYNTFIKPILSVIDSARKILQLLELLHVAWAKALDDALANLEHKITAPLLVAIQVINAIDSRIESYILTADNLFRRATLLGSIGRNLNSIANMQWNRALSTLDARGVEGPTGKDDLAPVDDHVQTLDDLLAGNYDAINVDVDSIVQALDDALAA